MSDKPKALVIGSNGTIGKALSNELVKKYDLIKLSQENTQYTEEGLDQFRQSFHSETVFSLIICCIGVLHDEVVQPEKNLKAIDQQKMSHYFQVNAILPMLCMQYFVSLLDKHSESVYINLSAMVGSTSDNRLGGWYGYRSSKAALNSLVKTTSIEVARTNKNATIVAMHPGTTVGSLSKPFSKKIDKAKYYSPEQTAKRILKVAKQLSPQDSGSFLNWDGSILPW